MENRVTKEERHREKFDDALEREREDVGWMKRVKRTTPAV